MLPESHDGYARHGIGQDGSGPGAALGEDELALRARGGCAHSFEELVRRFQVPLLRFLARRGASREDAEDLLQETFVRAYQNLQSFEPGRRFSTWLFTIAYRLAVSHHRGRRVGSPGHWPDGALRELADRVASAGPPDPALVAERAESGEVARRLWDVAARVLSEEQFSALWLYYVEGMGTRELTTVLGRSWVSVKTMLFRARAKLMPYLAQWDEGGAARRMKEGAAPRPESSLGRMLRESRPTLCGNTLLSPAAEALP